MLESARESVVSGIETVKHSITGEAVLSKEELPKKGALLADHRARLRRLIYCRKGIGEAIYESGAAIGNKVVSMVTPSKSSDTLASHDQTPGMGSLPGTKDQPVVPGSEPAPGAAGTYSKVGKADSVSVSVPSQDL